MATISDINAASNYRGQPAAGGALGVGITIDVSPLQRLATFKFYSDRDKWELKQKKDAIAAQQIANIAAYDTNSPFIEYTNDLTREAKELVEYVRDNPNVLKFDPNNPTKYIDVYQRIGKLENKRKRATANDALYNAAKATIELEPNKEERDKKLKLLDIRAKRLFKDGVEEGYRQQFEAMPQLKPQAYVVPEVPLTDDFFITPSPNYLTIGGNKFADIPRIFSMADAIYFGLNKKVEDFKGMTDDQKEEAMIENSITSKSRIELDNLAASANSLIGQFKANNKKPDGTGIKVGDIPEEILLENPTIGGVISLAKSFNETVDKINAASGNKNPHINLDDGVSPQELIVLETFGKNKDSFFTELKPTVQETNDEIERQRLALGWFNARTGRIQEDRLADAADVDKDMAKSAKAYAEALFNKMKSLANKDGIIPKANLSKFTVDELKYLGIGETTENKFTLTPFDMTGVSSILIDPDGTIKTFIGGTGRSLGTQRGTPINISTIATNKLGDEMTVTAGKEGYNFNNLIPLYQSGSTDVQQQATIQETELSSDPADWKQDGNNWRYKDGRLFDSKGKEIKKK